MRKEAAFALANICADGGGGKGGWAGVLKRGVVPWLAVGAGHRSGDGFDFGLPVPAGHEDSTCEAAPACLTAPTQTFLIHSFLCFTSPHPPHLQPQDTVNRLFAAA